MIFESETTRQWFHCGVLSPAEEELVLFGGCTTPSYNGARSNDVISIPMNNHPSRLATLSWKSISKYFAHIFESVPLEELMLLGFLPSQIEMIRF